MSDVTREDVVTPDGRGHVFLNDPTAGVHAIVDPDGKVHVYEPWAEGVHLSPEFMAALVAEWRRTQGGGA